MFAFRPAVKPNVGDGFVKVADKTPYTWEIAKIFVHVDGISHAVLKRRDRPREIITVSVLALADPSLFRKVPAAL